MIRQAVRGVRLQPDLQRSTRVNGPPKGGPHVRDARQMVRL